MISIISHAQNVGIGTETPSEKLEVSGNVKGTNVIATNSLQIPNGGGAGKILTSDNAGTGRWANAKRLPGSIDSTIYIAGIIVSPVPGAANIWEFLGPTSTITLNASQRIVMVGAAVLGGPSATSPFRIDVGYQLSNGGPVINASGTNFIEISPVSTTGLRKYSYSVAGSFKPGDGTYNIGCVVYCSTQANFTFNGNVNAYFMIVNE